MKKTYITPALLTVEVNTTTSLLQASSFGIYDSDVNVIDNSSDILVKEQLHGYNVWDDNWDQ